MKSVKNYFIYGFSLSGKSALNLIYNKKDEFFIYDNNTEIQKEAEIYSKKFDNVYVLNSTNKTLLKTMDVFVISPGVSIYDNIIVWAKRNNKKIIGELELGFRKCRKKIIAITGTNGKTTCVRLLTSILNFANKKALGVGNIGYPLSQAVVDKKKVRYFVCEVSSFQLESIRYFKPKLACILNITKDHINRHKTFKNYANTKKKICSNLTKKDFVVCQENLQINKTSGKIFNFGTKNTKNGCFLHKNNIIFSKNGKQQKVCSVNDFNLIGEHNLKNVLACVCLAKLLKVKNKFIIRALKDFTLSPHRLQKIYTYKSTVFYDDSKATNIDATICAIKSFNLPTTLILGGSDKGCNFDLIFSSLPNHIKFVLGCGEVKEKIEKSAKKFNKNVILFNSLKEATNFACMKAQEVKNVLLSPACASFDEFKNYKHRGEKFLEYIKDYYEKG